MTKAEIGSDALGAINEKGITQFRIYFTRDDNGDGRADWVGWYSAENAVRANRPMLEVTYWK
jgi:hypothetical protein